MCVMCAVKRRLAPANLQPMPPALLLYLNGQVKEFLDWVKKVAPVAKIGLALASIALKVCTGLSVSTDAFEAAFGASEDLSAFVEDALSAGIEGMTSKAENRLDRLQNSGPSERLPHAGVRGDGLQKVRLALVPTAGCFGSCQKWLGHQAES